MRRSMCLLVIVLSTFAMNVFANPQCNYWEVRSEYLSERIEIAQNRLDHCGEVDNCREMELLLIGLTNEKETVLDFLTKFCNEPT